VVGPSFFSLVDECFLVLLNLGLESIDSHFLLCEGPDLTPFLVASSGGVHANKVETRAKQGIPQGEGNTGGGFPGDLGHTPSWMAQHPQRVMLLSSP
jgi:hypothetical protein